MNNAIECYPFVKILDQRQIIDGKWHNPREDNPRIWFIYEICGTTYERWDYDDYIEDAIELANKWKTEEITYARIVYLRSWLRENEQHGHNLKFFTIRTMKGCKNFIDKLIETEYQYTEDDQERKDQIKTAKTQNEKMFS